MCGHDTKSHGLVMGLSSSGWRLALMILQVFFNLNYSMILCSSVIQRLMRYPSNHLESESYTSWAVYIQLMYTFSWEVWIHSVSLESSFICKRWIERGTAKLRLKEENQYYFIFLFVELGEECLQIIIIWYCEEIEIVVVIFQKDR